MVAVVVLDVNREESVCNFALHRTSWELQKGTVLASWAFGPTRSKK